MCCHQKKDLMKTHSKNILLYDLEVSRAVVEGYGNKWNFKVIKVIRPQLLMSFSWKWLGERHVHFHHMHGYSNYKDFVQSLSDTLAEAPIRVAHNGINFDDKMANTFFMAENVEIPPPHKSIDTCRIARQKLKLPSSNSLNDVAEFLGLGAKEKITYADIEDDFMSDTPSWKSIKQMEKYNNKDVRLLEDVYLKLRPLITNHPNIAVMGNAEGCTACGSTDFIYKGYAYTATTVYRRVQCRACGKWGRERTQDRDIQNKPYIVN